MWLSLYFDLYDNTLIFYRDVFLPLLCTDSDIMDHTSSNLPITSDKLMDVLHRLLGNIEITSATAEGSVSWKTKNIYIVCGI